MQNVNIFWDPNGFELDALGQKSLLKTSDGDTPHVSTSIRMLSIDTPELTHSASGYNRKMVQLAKWIESGVAPIHDALGEYLYPKLITNKAGTLQKKQGKKAKAYFDALLKEKLEDRENRKKRNIYLRASNEHFDKYGRILAYISPYYTKEELESLSRKERATFNLLMIESGWAASFPIYPSIPQYVDLVMFQQLAKEAYEGKLGAWKDNASLTGYEFRMCKKLYDVTKVMVAGEEVSSYRKRSWIDRYCVDMTSKEIFYPQEYYKVLPYNRIFIWAKDVSEAVAKMNLIPSL